MVAAMETESSLQKEITNIPMFKGEDFHEWKFKMQLVLEGKQVWNIVHREEETTSEEESDEYDNETKAASVKQKELPLNRKINWHIEKFV